MPSLPASHNKYSPQDSFRNYLPKEDNVQVKHGLLFIIYILLKISIASIVLMSPWYWLNYYICTNIDIYKNNKLYLLYEAYRGFIWYLYIAFICFQSCRFTYIYSIIIPSSINENNINKYPKFVLFIIVWIISLTIQTIGLCATSYIYHENHDHNPFHNNKDNKYVLNLLCKFITCKNEHIYHFYQFVFGFPVNIFLSITINHLIYVIFYFKNKSQINRQISMVSDQTSHNDHTTVNNNIVSPYSHSLLSHNSSKGMNSIISNNDYIGLYLPQYTHLYEKSSWIITQKYYFYVISYSFVLLIYLFILYLTISIKSRYFDKYYVEVAIILQTEGYIFNFILKRIARNLDILRMQKPRDIFISNMNNKQHKESGSLQNEIIIINNNQDISKQNEHDKLSLEVMTQSFIRLVYWIEYRYITIYDQPKPLVFAISKLLHFINLVWVVTIRPSNLYFIKSDKILKSIINYKYTPNMLKWFLSFFDTTSNSKQWTERSAIDTMLRFINAIGSCVVISILLYFGQDDWYQGTNHKWKVAVELTMIGAALEIFIYFPYSVLSYKYILKQQFITPFFRFYLYNKNKFIWCSAVLFACAACILPIREILNGPGSQ